MNIIINTKSSMPAYGQMAEQIVEAIRTDQYKPGDRLPSETEFCSETGLAKGTVRKAFDKLETEGYIRRVHGSGTYVLGWKEELRRLVQFTDLCRKANLSSQDTFQLLKDACSRFFTAEVTAKAAVLDCTPEIGKDIARELSKAWRFDLSCYEVGDVRSGDLIPPEEIWITTKTHYEEVLPVARETGRQLLQVKLLVPDEKEEEIQSLDDNCLLGIVYDSQDFLMHISHTLALLGMHNTYYLCQKEEWNDKKRAIREDNIIWLISVQEEEILKQMKTMGSRYIAFHYGVEKSSLDQIRAFMEKRRR